MDFAFFSSTYRTFSRIDHILDHKSSLGKFLKNEIIPSIFSDHNAVRLDVDYSKKKTIKNTNVEAEQRASEKPAHHRRNQKGNKMCRETTENEDTTQTRGVPQEQC